MEINHIYIHEDILDIMFDNLKLKEKISFCQTNSYTYNRYKQKIKESIYKYINVDYHFFYDLLQRYNYSSEELGLLKEKSIYGVNPVAAGIHTYYDLRFIFEIVYKYNRAFNNYDFPKDKSNLEICIQNIKNKISFNRFETINNINKEPSLFPLAHTFKPLSYKTREDRWSYLFGTPYMKQKH